MSTKNVKWEEMFPDELLNAIESCPVCYMAYGLAEPHGTYNALGLDWLKAYGLCEKGDHAGMCETQQLMVLRPDLVDLSQKEPSPRSGPWCGRDFSKSQQQPESEIGSSIVQSQIEKLGRVQKELLGNYQPIAGWSAPNQDEVEQMWHTFDRLTRKYWVLSTSWEEFREGPPPFPGWDALDS